MRSIRCGARVARSFLSALALASLLMGLAATSGVARAGDPPVGTPSRISGYVTHVRDGDTIEVARVPVRFSGISAPELSEPYGQQSKNAMRGLVAGQRVICDLTGRKTYDRWVGNCFLADGTDLSVAVVALGLARDCPRYSGGLYEPFETERSKRLPFPGYCKPK
ncbi:thermonuclease family protein [Limibacillus sp. MBR-115]|uniref:thermonuclease family protein n=1 Tax=Limibacillus sp. MBR-115 TaxID=3156465 RepID=UPI003395A89B